MNAGILPLFHDSVGVEPVQAAPYVLEELLLDWLALDVEVEFLLADHPAVGSLDEFLTGDLDWWLLRACLSG